MRAPHGFTLAADGAWRALLLGILFIGTCAAQDRSFSELDVKAAFLYKFASYVEWPIRDEAGGALERSFTIGVAGSNDLARALADVTRDRLVSDRPISIRRLGMGDSIDDLDILFIGKRNDRSRELLEAARLRPILTVTETATGLADGSIINFTLDGDRVRFQVSLYTAESSRLKLNARLLAVAEEVRREPE